MLSINTNLSSLIAQSSLKNSTNILNTAVERMSTGYKINHAKDNAANYSISTNMQTQIQSYDVAADNVAMGMDLVTTAMDIVLNMQDKANRLRALSTQARNGTYGTQSLNALQQEADAIVDEINRLYNTAEYNNISLFNRTEYTLPSHLPQVDINGFINITETYTEAELAAMTALTDDITTVSPGQQYSISTADELVNLAKLVNSGVNTSGVEFVLAADIDLTPIGNWTPIGDYSTNSSYQFKGIFNGNGHEIRNLTIDNVAKSHQGLFGYISNATVKNLILKKVNIKAGSYCGGLVGQGASSTISSCNVLGNIESTKQSYITGGIIGGGSAVNIDSCSVNCTVTGNSSVGGIAGYNNGDISNSIIKGNVEGTDFSYIGGMVGQVSKSSGNITFKNNISYANVINKKAGSYIGAILPTNDGVNFATINIQECYTTGQEQIPIYAVEKLNGTSSEPLTNYDKFTLLAKFSKLDFFVLVQICKLV